MDLRFEHGFSGFRLCVGHVDLSILVLIILILFEGWDLRFRAFGLGFGVENL